MSRTGWPPTGAARPPALLPPPTAESIAYRRYLRYLPEYRSRRRAEEPRGAQRGGEQRQDDEDDEGEEQEGGERSVESASKEGGEGAISISPDVSVSSLVRQYTNMLHARNTSSDAPYSFSRSCSNLLTQCRRPSSSLSGGTPPEGDQPRKGSLHCRSGAPNLVRSRSQSLPWPSESSWRWHSEPGLACEVQASGVAVGDTAPPHSASLANLDSATSDEGCPGDDVSTGPSPLPSPDCSVAHRLSGLITPFRSLSPASSVGSHLGSVEDLPLVRSMSAGHVLDSLRRSHSTDSAVEVEDGATSPMGSPLNDDPGVAEDSCEAPDEHGEGEDEGQVFCECSAATGCAEVNGAGEGEGEGGGKSDEDVVTLRHKKGETRSRQLSERRRGKVNGDAFLRNLRGCGVVGCGQRQQAQQGGVLRTPSVVISDYSGDTVSLTVALASSDFSLSHLDGLQHSASSPSLIPPTDDFSSRKVSSCSSCSSVSTVDFNTPLTLTPLLRRTHSPVEESNRISTASTYSYLSNSEDEVEHVLTRPQTPRKPSNWRKVRNIVQWTPFIQTYKKHKYPWVQLAGHQGNFRAGMKQGTILKKLCPPEEKALEAIMKDVLRPYVPRYSGVVEGADGEKYLQMEDLLSSYSLPCVMDIKMGVRTYLEDELAKAREKPKLRKDMYEKMIQIDPKAPTEAENRAKAVTKPRYMVWRETISSTATLGFRIEGVRRGDGTSSKDFKTTRTREQVLACLTSFLQGYPHVVSRYVQQLKSIKMTLEGSSFFKTHELIGSSLLFVHNDSSALVRMIDFAKTVPLPQGVAITHRNPWSEGTHEDGYLLGLENLIDIFTALEKVPPPTPNGTVTAASSTPATSSPPATAPTSVPAAAPQQLPDGGGDEVKVATAELTSLTISSASTTTTTTSATSPSTPSSTSEHHHRPHHHHHHSPAPPPIAPVPAPTPAPPT